ncbi:MAG: S26 family signal peptidase [Cetobacterium sp.]
MILKILSNNYIINVTKSLPRGVYKILHSKEFKKNDIVVFEIPEKAKKYLFDRKYVPSIVTSMMKAVASEKIDDVIEINNDNELIINNKNWGKVYKYDSYGRKLPEIDIEKMKVQKGEILLLSDYSDRSFDGRYFGVVPISSIKYKVELFLKF